MYRLNIYDFFIQNKQYDFSSNVFKFLWLERMQVDTIEVETLFAFVRKFCVENQKPSWQMKHAAIFGDEYSKSKIIFMKLRICFIQNHLCAVSKSSCLVSEPHFFQHFHFVHIFHIKFNKYVRTCKRKTHSYFAFRWINGIMRDIAAIISKLLFYFLLRNSNIKWPHPISLLKTTFEFS